MVARKLVARTFALSLACLTQIDGAHGCQIEAASEPIEEPRYYTWIDGIKQPLTLDTGCIVVLRKVDADAKVATDNAAWDEAKKADRSFLLKHGISAEAIQPNDLVRMWQVSLEARALDAAGVEGVVRAIAEDDSMMYCGPVFKDSQTGRRRWMKQSAVLEFDLDIDEPTALKLIQKDLPGEVVRKQKFGNRFQWQLQSTERSGFTLLNRLNAVATKQHVLCAEPIWVEPLQRNDIDRTSPQSALGVPEDEFVNAQWWIHNVGQHGYTPGLDMDLYEAWKMATGIGVRIALLDDGVDSSHPDIRISASPFNGLDFTVDPPSQNGSHNNECDFHGTNVAGVCSAIENTIGIIGTAPNSIAFSARMATNNCAGGYYTESVFISAAINHVAEAHIRILNISSGFPATQVIVNAMDYAESLRTMLIVAASGSGNAPGFPATYTYALAVAGVDGDGIGFGNSGVGSVIDVSGPASHVLTTDRVGALGRPAYSGNPDYTMQQGVSFASPAVAGVVALMLDANPRLEGVDAFQILRDTARDIYLPGRDNSTGYGLVNAAAAVNTAAALYVPGDANGDGKVTGQDLSVLLAQFGQQVPPDTGADFNGDGSVTGQDLSVLLALL